MDINLVVAVLSFIIAIIFIIIKYWAYDRCCEGSFVEGAKIYVILIGTLKDVIVIYAILHFLLYGSIY